MKKSLFFKCFLAAFMLTIGMGLSAQNTLTNACPGYCNPSGAGAAPGTAGGFYGVVNTEANGDITFTMLGVPNNNGTIFRNNGWADAPVLALTVNGDPNTGNKYFTRTIDAGKTKITLVKQSTIPANATIEVNQILEYQTSTSGDGANLWPTIDFVFQYGTTCNFVQTPLVAPVVSNIDANKKITFSTVPNAGSYVVNVYRADALVYTQTVSSGDVVNFVPTTTYDYTVQLQSVSNDINHVNSINPTSYTWHLTAGVVDLGPSIFCNNILGSTNSTAYITWQTDANGNVVISLAGYAGDANTAFRGNGMGADLTKFTVNGNPASNYFTKTYAGAGSLTYTLTLKSGASIIPGDKISYTGGTVEWKTTGNTNAYGTYSFLQYVYGTNCSGLPNVSPNPTSIAFTPNTGVQTFTLTGANLTGAVTINPPMGLTVNPSTITPDGNKNINQPVTVTWAGGTASGSFIQISGGGMVSSVPVLVNATGFSNFCNKIIYQDGTSNWPAYMNINMSSNNTQMTFTISPYNAGETATWNSIAHISVNSGVNDAMVATKVLSTDKTQFTVTFNSALHTGDLVTFGSALVWTVIRTSTSNTNVYINALQGPYTVGQTCSLVSGGVTQEATILDNVSNVYPNPASDKIYVTGDVSEIALFSLQGQLVHSVLNNNSMNVSSFAKGLYIVRTTDKAGITRSSKLEIQ